MENPINLRGMANVSFWASDLKAAKEWYSQLLGMEPYFQRPDPDNLAYIEFRIGDYQHELGIIDKQYAPAGGQSEPGGSVLYWHVEDIEVTLHQLIQHGAKLYEPLTERGINWFTASVTDPFGNIIGLIHSPHYKKVWTSLH